MRTTLTAITAAGAAVLIAGLAFSSGSATARAGANAGSSRATTPSVATVNTLSLLEAGLQVESRRSLRLERGQMWQDRLAEVRGQLETLEMRLREIEATAGVLAAQDPQRQELATQFQQTRVQVQATQREGQVIASDAQADLQQLNANQASEVFALVAAKARELAEQGGYTHLMSKRDDLGIEVPDTPNAFATVTQEILARGVLLAPEGDDLTEQVRAALGLPTPEELEQIAEEQAAENEAAGEDPAIEPGAAMPGGG